MKTISALAATIIIAAALMACATPTSSTYQPTGSPIISIGDTVAIYSAYYQSFCYWRNYDVSMIYDWEVIKCNFGKTELADATRFTLVSPYPRQVCGRIPTPLLPHNISVAFSVKVPLCRSPDPTLVCGMDNTWSDGYTIHCNPYVNSATASFALTNTAAPPSGADGWLHGGETPIAIRSRFMDAPCAVDSGVGKIRCPAPVPAIDPAASVFYLIPTDPAPDHEC